jgi:tetratricopeptide (TPR) repeat protein
LDENASVIFVGHSLGGGLAQYCGLAFGKDTYCFNSAALGYSTVLSLGGNAVTNASNIRHFVTKGEPVFFPSMIVPGSLQAGTVWLIEPNPKLLGKPNTFAALHNMDSMAAEILGQGRMSQSMSFNEARLQDGAFRKSRLQNDLEVVAAAAGREEDSSETNAKGVRIHFDERILTEVLQKGTTEENAKLLDGLTQVLASARSESERTQAVAAFEDQVKRRFLELRQVCPLHDLVAVSLKSLVARAERYQGAWGELPDDLRQAGALTRLHGFALAGDDILLIGRRESGAPILEIDDLIVGVQSAWKENATPLVSLDPDPANIEGDPNVRIQGVADDSAFALTMLEADYAMKKIMAGVEPVEVPGYRTLKDTLSKTDRTFMSRFWLYPVQPRVGEIRVSSDNSSVVFVGAIQVLSEEMLNLKEGLVGTGQAFLPAEEAADSFTACYDQIAARRPVFKRLQSLFDVVLVARVWHVRGLQSALLDRLCALPHRAVKIPRTYQAIRVPLRRDANGEYYLQGGVQAKIGAGRRTWLDLDDSGLSALRQSCQRISGSGEVAAPLANLTLNAIAPTARPDSSSRDFTSATTNLFRGNLPAALAAANRLLTQDRFDAEALGLRALIQLRLADYARARADARQAREIDPGDREAAAAAGQILFQCAWMQGDPEGALREMEDSIKDDLQRASGQVSRGEALVLLDRPDEAKQAYLHALELDPASAMACAHLVQLELSQGRTLAAKPWVQKARALDANLPAVRIASAQWELATVRPDLAEKIAGEVWEKPASGPTARLQALAILAAVSASREKWNDVDKYVARMDELSAGSPEVLVAASEIAMQWGERERAATYLEKAVKLSPRHPLVLKMLARLAR